MPAITIRVSDATAHYRRIATASRNIPKNKFDQEVYDYYEQHHPLDRPDTNQQETT